MEPTIFNAKQGAEIVIAKVQIDNLQRYRKQVQRKVRNGRIRPAALANLKQQLEQVSWEDAEEFCKRLSQKTGKEYTLPNEAQWEYACRAGTTTPFHFGPTITTDLANYRGTDWTYNNKTYPGSYGNGSKGEYREETTEVGIFAIANPFGLYDMHGNVWEWCLDDWHANYKDAPRDRSAWLSSDKRKILRGGSWGGNPGYCRSAVRYWFDLGNHFNRFGFRVACFPLST